MKSGFDVSVRAMGYEDAGAVEELAGQLGYARTPEEVSAWLARPPEVWGRQMAFVACDEGLVVGWVEVSVVQPLQSAAHGLIGGLVVREGVRGGGIGRRLRERAEAWAWEQGVEEMVVTSRSTRHAAHRFYLRDGYRRVKTSEVFAKGRGGALGDS